MNRIFPLNSSNKNLDENQIQEVVDLLNRISLKSRKSVNGLKSQLRFMKRGSTEASVIQTEINTELQKWSDKVKRVGATPLGVYRCRIATPEKTFLWEYPSKIAEPL